MHIKPTTRVRPIVAQNSDALGKSLLNGILFGVNPIFLFLLSDKISGNKGEEAAS